ncbi:ANAPC3 and TPR domain-containing protein [Phanerochaete sordida]|uniref:ANAPC3 and TPR domain-containing protein n=1 Tax=Phanerochaete sordida TaxID=48140 RepID=A0A9P3LAK3_9APHY|nr:ANAPC3 and TPR domain-containing protein [Phanerochaete sordida]
MQAEASSSASDDKCLPARFAQLIWSCLDANLHRSAVFYAERYYAMSPTHDARHLYATALLQSGQPHMAHYFVNRPATDKCSGCAEVRAKCCTALGRHRQAQDALDECLQDPLYTPTQSMEARSASAFPEPAVLHCRAGAMALKGNLPDRARHSFLQALALNPMLWEAFEGLCALGHVPEVDLIFPPRPPPRRPAPGEETLFRPTVTGAGFFTPAAGSNGNLFRFWQPDTTHARPSGPRDSLSTVDSSFFAEDSFQFKAPGLPASRSQPGLSDAVLPPAVRPLSSADEMGPAAKKLRSTVRQRVLPSSAADSNHIKPSKSAGAALEGADDRSKSSKARARPALSIANIFSSPGRRVQDPATSSKFNAATTSRSTAEQRVPPSTLGPARRSSRLQLGTNSKPTKPPAKNAKERRRVSTRTRSNSESEMDEEPVALPRASSPGSEGQGSSGVAAQQPQAAQEAYEMELADYAIYNLMRICALATRALAMYDCRASLEFLDLLSVEHQRSAWVMAMVGKAHYEMSEYSAAERAFEAVRSLEPYRLWDMEVYSTLLWHLQRHVKLSYLAHELLAINPRSPEAWIAVGNCFSLQKERSQALTCFHRAAQLDTTCAYAYTLSGHESIDDDLDKAITFFEFALRADARHYNAWYGLGTCYMRMSRLRQAEYHYGKAAEIHPHNAVLLGCVGMVKERQGKLDAALDLFDEAVRLSPDNALVRYHRAKVLIAMKKYKRAAEDLEALRDTSPDESNVVFQLAKVYRLMGDKVKSAQTLAIARDVSPKSINKIRKLLETVKDESAEDVMDEG